MRYKCDIITCAINTARYKRRYPRALVHFGPAAGGARSTVMHRRVLSGGELVANRFAVHTRVGAALALMGSVAGFLTAAGLGLTASAAAGPGVYDGLYGYNGALTALCVGGLFFAPTGGRSALFALASAT